MSDSYPSLPNPKCYTRDTVGPLTYAQAVSALLRNDQPWKRVCAFYQDGSTAGACAAAIQKETVNDSQAQLLCETWDFLERMPEPTDFPRHTERESLLVRLRAWGK